MAEEVYMMEPPKGQGRWEAGSAATIQIILGACLFTLGTVVYGLRILTRVRLLKNPLRLDDFLTGASLIACWVFHACAMGMVAQGGCATNFWQVTQSQYESLLKWTIPVNIFYMLSSDLAKISLLFFYLRLSPERTFRIVIYVLISLFGLYALIYAIISFFGCQPIKASWDLAAQATSKCVDKFGFFLAASVANVIMDMVILLLPLRIVIPLQIPRRQKMSLLFLFTTGGFVITVAIYNFVLTVKLFSSPNYTWGLAYELCWMYAELTGCVICASASSLKPFFKRILPNIFSSHGASYGGPSGATGGSNAIKSRKQLSRKQADAIELQSGDDSESGRKVTDDDEATLWPKPQQSFDNGNHQVLVTAPRVSSSIAGSRRSNSHYHRNGKADGIEIVSTTEVMYSPR
ncbi:L-fucose permease [Fusarium mexicanum]|uniref:L-fucose permease n=1 Tax=Fusarium mexicanum TaxID=751941 RepID=A0A8H5J3K9_9HYPO|nr:L-fucose permease [Fusarium mexicanum]